MKLHFYFAFVLYGCCYLLSYAYGCRDNRDTNTCTSWYRYGYCRTNAYTRTNCKKTCGLCSVSQSACYNNNQFCSDWAKRGECQRNPAYMKQYCKKSCGLCPVNGNWANWGRWSTCTRSCGGGSMTRRRTCSNPAPKNGGRTCVGSKVQSAACNKSPCPVIVHGNWGSWTSWAACSKTCGRGITARTRTCSNPAPKNGGRACQGSNRQTTNCNSQQCPVHGNWGSWTGWAACSKTCGGGIRVRTRTCSNPAPQNGGRACQGSNRQTTNCNSQKCPALPCRDYKVLNEPDRNVKFRVGPQPKYDTNLNGWYSFSGAAGNGMATACPYNGQRCGAHASGWMQGRITPYYCGR